MNLRLLLLLLLLLLCCLLSTSSLLYAQDILTITGQILDKETNKPIAYAHIGIPAIGIGTTSGDNGEFILKVPAGHQNSTINVSFIGYSSFKQSISAIHSPVTIHLSRSLNKLSEVVVMGESAIEGIIRKAVKKIPKNYPTRATSALAFYRESRTDDSLHYLYLAEGVLNVYKKSYKSKREGTVSLVQGRKINLKNPLDTIVRSGFSSGHMAAHRFDFVQNRIDFIDPRFFKVYKYWIESVTTYNDRPVYIIGFGPNPTVIGPQGEVVVDNGQKKSGLLKVLSFFKKKKRTIEARMEGKIYIDKESYAFIRAEFNVTTEGLKVYDYYPLYAGRWKGNAYVVNYRKVGKKWYFSDALREGLYGQGGTYSNEVKITEINTGKATFIPYLERMEGGYEFTRMTGQYDENFWENYNTTPLNEGLAESVQQLENIKKAQEVFDTQKMANLQQKRDSIQRINTLATGVKSEGSRTLDLGEPGFIRKKKRSYKRVKFMLGLGTHLLETTPGQMGIAYFESGNQSILPIVSVNEMVENRPLEVVMNWDMDVFLRKHLFIRFGNSFDFYNSVYKERSIGLGTELNLSKQRPFYIKAVVQYNYSQYARKIGQAVNEGENFEVDKEKFKGKYINLYYGQTSHNVKFSAELSLELNRGREIYIRGTYHLPFAQKQEVWFKERRKLFRKKEHIDVRDERLLVTQNDTPFQGTIQGADVFSVSVGILFK